MLGAVSFFLQLKSVAMIARERSVYFMGLNFLLERRRMEKVTFFQSLFNNNLSCSDNPGGVEEFIKINPPPTNSFAGEEIVFDWAC